MLISSIYTVEPLITDTPKSGQPPYNGHTVHPLPILYCPYISTSTTSEQWTKHSSPTCPLFGGSTVNHFLPAVQDVLHSTQCILEIEKVRFEQIMAKSKAPMITTLCKQCMQKPTEHKAWSQWFIVYRIDTLYCTKSFSL